MKIFSLGEISRSTNNFDPKRVIGIGGYGKVYKGRIDGGATKVAVKRLNPQSWQGEMEFRTEIRMLSTLRHGNLVSLIGYCNEGREMLLVYQYMSRGSLSDHLFKVGRDESLPWEQRIKIAIGSARGLDFLHTCPNRVIHRDVKTSNILLDENWESKISDFGLSKMGPRNESAIITQVKGTPGYLDPQYNNTHRLTWKSDVYAFGVVLFELLSGRPAIDRRLPVASLALWAKRCIRKGEVNKLIDQKLAAGFISSPCLKAFVRIAAKCLENNPHDRPTMNQVVRTLKLALIFQQNSASDTLTSRYSRVNQKICFMLYATDLLIAWADDIRCWNWIKTRETSNTTFLAAELRRVCRLNICGRFGITALSPGTMYEIVFVVKIKMNAYGWEYPVTLKLILPNNSTKVKKVNLQEKEKGKWIELRVGDFMRSSKSAVRNNGIQVYLSETNNSNWKAGLIVKGIYVRPKV